jgi:hypothetical protein
MHEVESAAMPEPRSAFVHEADLRLGDGSDPAAVGAAVTVALCGHWKHEGPCRWPHNNDIEVLDWGATFRMLFVAPASDEAEVRERIERSLREGTRWVVGRTQSRPVSIAEAPLAQRLATAPRAVKPT